MSDYPVIKISGIRTEKTQYAGTVIGEQTITKLFPEIPPSNQPGAGIYAIMQFILKNLLTEKGSNAYDPEYGCSLLYYKGRNVTQQAIKDLHIELKSLIPLWMERIEEIEDRLDTEENNRIQNIKIKRLYFDVKKAALVLKLQLETNIESFPITVDV